ncbi:MAG: nitroreductase family protein [Nocardioidaceae bacterium]|nr:MAG: nitroreductase family protein [Nocardioidaceae bacterium]
MTVPTLTRAQELVRMACYAPSAYNSQPWSWRINQDGAEVELHADRSRQLAVTDPTGRNLALACGAALDHFETAARAFGLHAEVALFPDPNQPDLFARLQLSSTSTSPHDIDMLTAIENRRTDRRGFTDWELPPGRVENLARAAAIVDVGVTAAPLAMQGQVETLIEEARQKHLRDPDVAAELDAWVRRHSSDGVPPEAAVPDRREQVTPPPDRFSRSSIAPSETSTAQVVVLSTAGDEQPDWLAAGRGLSRVWLEAAVEGLAVVPQTQITEVESTRIALRQLLELAGWPQVVVRLGWQESSAPHLPAPPARTRRCASPSSADEEENR